VLRPDRDHLYFGGESDVRNLMRDRRFDGQVWQSVMKMASREPSGCRPGRSAPSRYLEDSRPAVVVPVEDCATAMAGVD
jgi:hypothetical protein